MFQKNPEHPIQTQTRHETQEVRRNLGPRYSDLCTVLGPQISAPILWTLCRQLLCLLHCPRTPLLSDSNKPYSLHPRYATQCDACYVQYSHRVQTENVHE